MIAVIKKHKIKIEAFSGNSLYVDYGNGLNSTSLIKFFYSLYNLISVVFQPFYLKSETFGEI
jgi:hypothetical protein